MLTRKISLVQVRYASSWKGTSAAVAMGMNTSCGLCCKVLSFGCPQVRKQGYFRRVRQLVAGQWQHEHTRVACHHLTQVTTFAELHAFQ